MDFYTVLNLISNEKVRVSEKTSKPSQSSMKLIAEHLFDEDFFNPALYPPKHKYDTIPGYIRAYSWPLLLQEGKLAKEANGKLLLTKKGQEALTKSLPATIRELHEKWIKQKKFDEFNRIDSIKGQGSRGRTMTSSIERKEKIISALNLCPQNKWIAIEEFSRYSIAQGLTFDVCYDPWDLYIEDREYGSLGYEGFHDWSILQERYILVLFMEYFATLGLLDIAYIDPRNARDDYHSLWGIDDYDFLSRYDGLLYFRINPLGSYCLGMTKKYEEKKKESVKKIELMANLELYLKETLSSSEKVFLEKVALQKQDYIWKLDETIILSSIEKGISFVNIKQFLITLSENSIPKSVELLLEKIERNSNRVEEKFEAIVFTFDDANLAREISHKKRIKEYSYLCGERSVAVKKSKIDAFYVELKKMGYIVPLKDFGKIRKGKDKK